MKPLENSWVIPIVDIASKLIIPLAIFCAGYLISAQNRDADQVQQALKTSFDAVEKLTSENAQTRRYTTMMLNEFALKSQLPPAILPVLVDVANNDTDPQAAGQARQTINNVATRDPADAPTSDSTAGKSVGTINKADIQKASETLASLTTNVYIQVPANDADAAQKARALAAVLNANGFAAPGVERVSNAPQRNELRYFHKADVDAGIVKRLLDLLKSQQIDEMTPVYIPGYENSTSIPKGQVELWFGSVSTSRP
jgi:hypothetical protein